MRRMSVQPGCGTERDGALAIDVRALDHLLTSAAFDPVEDLPPDLATVDRVVDLLCAGLLARYTGRARRLHRVVLARVLRDGGAAALIAALDAVAEAAGRTGSRRLALEAFVLAIEADERVEFADLDPSDGRARLIGADADLLERVADEREAYAADALGIDSVEEDRAVADAEALRRLALRHKIHFAGRDAAPRPPYVAEPGTCVKVGA